MLAVSVEDMFKINYIGDFRPFLPRRLPPCGNTVLLSPSSSSSDSPKCGAKWKRRKRRRKGEGLPQRKKSREGWEVRGRLTGGRKAPWGDGAGWKKKRGQLVVIYSRTLSFVHEAMAEMWVKRALLFRN